MLELLAATSNAGKLRELKELFADFPIKLRSLDEFDNLIEPEENGTTFAENAILKARYYATETGIWALADDSGLEVEALNDAPGVFSARYGGVNSTYSQKIKTLLSEVENTQDKKRLAKFVCAIAISDETGIIKNLAHGMCKGRLALSPTGTNGFGYDPIFIPDGFNETFGVISSDVKQKISHRSQAFFKIIEFLSNFLVS